MAAAGAYLPRVPCQVDGCGGDDGREDGAGSTKHSQLLVGLAEVLVKTGGKEGVGGREEGEEGGGGGRGEGAVGENEVDFH